MKVALGQFAVQREWQHNLDTVLEMMERALSEGADLLVLPESLLARDNTDPQWALQSAQPLEGPFVSRLRRQSLGSALTTVMSVYTPTGDGRAYNELIALRDGEIIARYRKLHLYDAFTMQESKHVTPGDAVPPLLEVAGMKVGLMTCYDVRFPELARRLASDGAQVLVLPSAWVKGPLKEMHWEVLVTARALENTCYMVAVGECGERNIGNSMAVDPLGVPIARAAEEPALLFAELDAERVAHARRVLPVLANRRFAVPQLR